MALLIVILIIWLMLYLGRKGKVYRAEKKSMQQQARKRQKVTTKEIDELITVIIPTINNDK
mgnify:CR=1 FL=1